MKKILILMLALLSVGCRPRPDNPGSQTPAPSALLVMRPVMSSPEIAGQMALLRETFPQAEVIDYEGLGNLLPEPVEDPPPLLVPAASLFPVEALDRLADYARDGGGVLLWGEGPFREQVVLSDGQAYRRDAFTAEMMKLGVSPERMPRMELWRHVNDSGWVQGSVRRVQGAAPWPGGIVAMNELKVWDGLQLDIPEGMEENWDTILFYANGGQRSTWLVIRVEEKDKSVWVTEVPLRKSWEPFALNEREFRHVEGGLGRGIEPDRLNMSQVRRITVGLDMRHAPQHPGRHEFGVSEIKFTADLRPPQQILSDWERFPLAHPDLRFKTRAQTFENLLSGRLHSGEAIAFESPLTGPRGLGEKMPGGFRWIPVVKAVSGSTASGAYPASLFWAHEADGGLGRWGWVGMDLDLQNRDLVKTLLLTTLNRLHQPVALAHVEAPPLVVRPDAFLKAVADCRLYARQDGDVRIIAELFKEDGLMIRRTRFPGLFKSAGSNQVMRVPLSIGVMPFQPGEENRYRIRIALEDEERNQVLDEVEQPVVVLPAKREPPRLDPITIRGSQLVIHNLSQFLLGLDYQPSMVRSQKAGAGTRHWLDHGVFDAQTVTRDLERLSKLGVTTLEILVGHESQAPQLNFFLEEAARHKFWIILSMDALNPLQPRLDEALRLLEAIDIKNRPEILALQVLRDVRLGSYQKRMALDKQWAIWLEEQFATPEQFEKVVKAPVWTILDKPTGPTDFELSNEGNHAGAVTVYRRFVQDYVSRRLGLVKRVLRAEGIHTFIAVRGGFSGNAMTVVPGQFPLDLAVGAVHADILMPSGNGLYGTLDQFYESAFLTAYARGVSGGKPVVWSGLGVPAPSERVPLYLENQDRIFLNNFLLATLSHASGLLVSTYAEARPLKAGDYAGILRPDGSLRPAGNSFREFEHRLRKTRPMVREWKGRETEPPVHARGFLALWDSWHQVYHKELRDGAMEEIRSFGFSYSTKNMPLVSLGGNAFSAPAPFACINAEWGVVSSGGTTDVRRSPAPIRVKVRGEVQLELINTGPSTWEPSRESFDRSVWVVAMREDRKVSMLKVPRLEFGKSTVIDWVPSDAGRWRLRPLLKGVGEFGESLLVEVE